MTLAHVQSNRRVRCYSSCRLFLCCQVYLSICCVCVCVCVRACVCMRAEAKTISFYSQGYLAAEAQSGTTGGWWGAENLQTLDTWSLSCLLRPSGGWHGQGNIFPDCQGNLQDVRQKISRAQWMWSVFGLVLPLKLWFKVLLNFLPLGARKQKLHSHNTFFMNMCIGSNDTLLQHFTH